MHIHLRSTLSSKMRHRTPDWLLKHTHSFELQWLRKAPKTLLRVIQHPRISSAHMQMELLLLQTAY